MPKHDWERIRKGKSDYRDRMAALPFDEKMRLLERLRARTMEVAGSWATTVNPRVPASSVRIVDLRLTAQVGQNVSGAASVAYMGARATLAASIAASAAPQSSKLSVSVLKRD